MTPSPDDSGKPFISPASEGESEYDSETTAESTSEHPKVIKGRAQHHCQASRLEGAKELLSLQRHGPLVAARAARGSWLQVPLVGLAHVEQILQCAARSKLGRARPRLQL